MGMRIRAWWETHWLPAVVVLGALPSAFIATGWFRGREVIVLPTCTGPLPPAIGDCPPYIYVELNLPAAWTAAGLVAMVLLILGVVARLCVRNGWNVWTFVQSNSQATPMRDRNRSPGDSAPPR
jgi:hypothetical protein